MKTICETILEKISRLTEDDETPESRSPNRKSTLRPGSIDDQIDRYLIQAEKDALSAARANDEDDGEVNRFSNDLDIASFASRVGRLVASYDHLIDVPTAIANRCIAFVAENYGSEQSAALKDELQSTHGIDLGDTEEPQPPLAAQAGPLGGEGGLP